MIVWDALPPEPEQLRSSSRTFSALWAECGPWTSGKRRNHFQDPSAKMTAELRPSVSTAALDVPVMASWCSNKTNHLRAFTNFP